MSTETVLIVDPDADTREILGLALARAGLRTLRAADGAEALAALEREPVSMVITDLYLPAGNERCLLRALKQHPAWCELPVLAYTTRLAPSDREWAQRQQCDLMLAKPTPITLIIQHVRQLLARRVPADGAA